MNEFSFSISGLQLDGCLFHLVKNVKHKTVENELTLQYKKELHSCPSVCMISVLIFVPPAIVEMALQDLNNHLLIKLLLVRNHFKYNHLDQLQVSGSRHPSIILLETWNVHERVLTNPIAELTMLKLLGDHFRRGWACNIHL